MPDAPDPDTLPDNQVRMKKLAREIPPTKLSPQMKSWLERPRPIEVRLATPPRGMFNAEKREPRQMVWLRAKGTLPDDPLLHQCVVAYASDMTLLDTATLPHGIPMAWMNAHYQMASLDHAMWFHRPFRADEWILYSEESPSTSGARGFAIGHMFRRDGRLIATVAQEGLIRPVGEKVKAQLAR